MYELRKSATLLRHLILLLLFLGATRALATAQSPATPPEHSVQHGEGENGGIGIVLMPMQRDNNLSELHDTFWKLNQLEGTDVSLSSVVVNIEKSLIRLSTPAYSISSPFQFGLTGPKFQIYQTDSRYIETLQATDQQVANAFENALQKTASYETRQGTFAFYDKDRQPLFVLNPIQSTGIENRQWRIAKYRGDGSSQADKEGLIDAKNREWIAFSNGRVEGSPGCGAWVGTYKLSGDDLTFQAGWFLEGICEPKDMDSDPVVEKAFVSGIRIEQSGNQVLLRDKNGKAQVLLVPY